MVTQIRVHVMQSTYHWVSLTQQSQNCMCSLIMERLEMLPSEVFSILLVKVIIIKLFWGV